MSPQIAKLIRKIEHWRMNSKQRAMPRIGREHGKVRFEQELLRRAIANGR